MFTTIELNCFMDRLIEDNAWDNRPKPLPTTAASLSETFYDYCSEGFNPTTEEIQQIISAIEAVEIGQEDLVIDIAGRYLVGKELPIALPTLEEAEAMLTAEKPTAWWGGAKSLHQWALRALDEILEAKNYMASNGRDLHEFIPSAN